MYPTGSFERFRCDILEKYDEFEFITFGILIADSRQSCTKEYILNYVDMFNDQSGRYFDFFIPGYSEFPSNDDAKDYITIGEKKYYFSYQQFKEFVYGLEDSFSLKFRYTFNPMLILMSMKPGHFDSAEFIILELDELNEFGIRRSGELFRTIFDKARYTNELREIRSGFKKTYIKNNCLDSIINAISPSWMLELKKAYGKAKCYRIKGLR